MMAIKRRRGLDPRSDSGMPGRTIVLKKMLIIQRLVVVWREPLDDSTLSRPGHRWVQVQFKLFNGNRER
jgi:hypothetical protein